MTNKEVIEAFEIIRDWCQIQDEIDGYSLDDLAKFATEAMRILNDR